MVLKHMTIRPPRLHVQAASLPAAEVTHVTGLKFVFEYHLWLRPFVTAENGCSTMYYNATVHAVVD